MSAFAIRGAATFAGALFAAATILGSPTAQVAADDLADVEADPTAIVAASQGVSLTEAAKELALQDLAGRAEPEMARALGPTFAGLFIEDSPVRRVIVMSTDSSDASTAAKVAESVGLGSDWTFRTAKYSLARLQDDALAVSRQLTSHADVWWDLVQNSVEVRTLPSYVLPIELPATANLGEVPVLARPATKIIGGKALSNGCSVGFTIKQGATNGIVTAGHCNNVQAFAGVNLPFVGEHYADSTDAQWHTAPGLSTPNQVYLKELDSFLVINHRTGISGQNVGGAFCKAGWTTGFDCGNLDNKGFCAVWVPNWTCTYGMGSHDGLDMASAGDSGGSIWSGDSAWGIVSGETWNIHTSCTCNVVYTPVNYFEAEMGVVVKTAP